VRVHLLNMNQGLFITRSFVSMDGLNVNVLQKLLLQLKHVHLIIMYLLTSNMVVTFNFCITMGSPCYEIYLR